MRAKHVSIVKEKNNLSVGMKSVFNAGLNRHERRRLGLVGESNNQPIVGQWDKFTGTEKRAIRRGEYYGKR